MPIYDVKTVKYNHYSDVTWASLCLNHCQLDYLFNRLFQANIKENKVAYYWPFWRRRHSWPVASLFHQWIAFRKWPVTAENVSMASHHHAVSRWRKWTKFLHHSYEGYFVCNTHDICSYKKKFKITHSKLRHLLGANWSSNRTVCCHYVD